MQYTLIRSSFLGDLVSCLSVCLFVCWHRIYLCNSPSYPRTSSVDPPACASHVLGLKASATMAWLYLWVLITWLHQGKSIFTFNISRVHESAYWFFTFDMIRFWHVSNSSSPLLRGNQYPDARALPTLNVKIFCKESVIAALLLLLLRSRTFLRPFLSTKGTAPFIPVQITVNRLASHTTRGEYHT